MAIYVSEAQLIYIIEIDKDIREESLYEDIYTDDFKSFYIYKFYPSCNGLIIKEYLKRIDNEGKFSCSKFIYKTDLNFKLSDQRR